MSSESGTDSLAPDIEVSQQFPGQGDRPTLTSEEYADLRAEYGRIRSWAKTNPDRFQSLQRSLSQARMGTTYDVYLKQCVQYAALATLIGLVAGAVVGATLAMTGVFADLRFPVAVGGDIAAFFRANKSLVAGIILAGTIATAMGVGTFLGTYRYPSYRAGRRGKRINFLLPHGIVYMYALSYGGTNLVGVVDSLADSADAYDEVAHEFDAVRRDVELFGNDIITALQNQRNLTPSPMLERFLDDLISVLDTGGDVTTFLESSSKSYLEDAEQEQEQFLNTIAVYSEVYIAAFVAAPLFAVVILIVISFLGGATTGLMFGLIYVAFPVGMALFLAILSMLSAAYRYPDTHLEMPPDPTDTEGTATDISDDERFKRYQRDNRWARFRPMLSSPLDTLRSNPLWTLAVTVPVAVIYGIVVISTGLATPGEMTTRPVATTSLLLIYPFLLVVVPLALFAELKRSREQAILDRLPASLNVLSSANRMGIPFDRSLDILTRYTGGTLSQELRITRNDVYWSNDLNRSLLGMANRVRVPQLSRTLKLIADGARSSGDLARVLAIAASDARDRQRLSKKRSDEMSVYLAVVMIGFLVYLMVIVLLDIGYLRPIEELTAEGAGDISSPVTLADLPTETYRMLMFHSVLIQAIGTGLIAGKLSDDSVLSGLKYAIGLIVLTLIVFTLIQP